MTERSAEQTPVETRPQGHETNQDTARIPLNERLQRRVAAADQRRTNGQAARGTGRVLPPMPPELARQKTEQRTEPQPEQKTAKKTSRPTRKRAASKSAPAPAAPRPAESEPTPRAVQAVSDQTAPVPVVPVRPATSTAQRPAGAPARAPRRARLRLSRIDPWSVMKVSFLLSIAFGIVTVVSVFLVWSVLGAAGVWDSINNTVSDTVSSGNNVSTFDITDYLGMSRVLGFTMLVSVIDVILITAIATLGAFLYNMAASLLGGIEVTLAEDA
jgi:hypothetical protein